MIYILVGASEPFALIDLSSTFNEAKFMCELRDAFGLVLIATNWMVELEMCGRSC